MSPKKLGKPRKPSEIDRLRMTVRFTSGSQMGQDLVLDGAKTKYFVGRDIDNDIALEPSEVSASRSHAEISCDATDVWLIDSGSQNGTFVNGTEIKRSKLNKGDQVRFGDEGPTIEIVDFKVLFKKQSRIPFLTIISLAVVVIAFVALYFFYLKPRQESQEAEADQAKRQSAVEIDKFRAENQRLKEDNAASRKRIQGQVDELDSRINDLSQASTDGNRAETRALIDSLDEAKAFYEAQLRRRRLLQKRSDDIRMIVGVLLANYLLVDEDNRMALVDKHGKATRTGRKDPRPADVQSAIATGLLIDDDLVISSRELRPPDTPPMLAKEFGEGKYRYKAYDIRMYFPARNTFYTVLADTSIDLEAYGLAAYRIESAEPLPIAPELEDRLAPADHKVIDGDSLRVLTFPEYTLNQMGKNHLADIDINRTLWKDHEIWDVHKHSAMRAGLEHSELVLLALSSAAADSRDGSFVLTYSDYAGLTALILSEDHLIVGLYSASHQKAFDLRRIVANLSPIR